MVEISLKSSDLLYLSASINEVSSAYATIIIVPGLNEYKERYFEMIDYFVNNKFNIVIYDPRGQGKSINNENTLGFISDAQKLIDDFKNIDINELENIIHPCGFYKNKAKNIKLCAKQVIENFNGKLPHSMPELLTLSGIGRKSANVIMLEAFGIAEGIAVDTHAKRISNRIGLSNESEPEKIEQDLIKIFPKETLKDINHLFMWLGRNTCEARNPHCDSCSVKQFCEFYKKNNQGYT